MKRAVLYARVSTDAQQKEGTVDSQVLELKRQIAAAGDVLIKEYVDDGYSGSLLDRPGLEALRRDVRTSLFDAVYFLDTDRIARDVAYQTIILGELLKYGKQIIIKGRDYVNNPENKFTVTVLGAVAELERAKIIERTTRGRLHRLRMGELSSHGHRIYGYDYVRKTETATAALVINEEQAPVVRSIFEMFASGRFGLVTISRSLEERRVPTRLGRPLWQRDQIKAMLKNETYAGTRYFNRITRATEAYREGRQVIGGRWVYRDPTEWIPVKVPPIVSRELFETVHEKLRVHEELHCRPVTHYLLQGLVRCGVCGSRCSSSRRYQKVLRPSGRLSVYHRSVYRCNRRARENMHDRTRIERCRSSEIGTHILEGKVFEMIREIMLDPAKLRGCIDTGGRLDDQSIARELARVAGQARALDEERRRVCCGADGGRRIHHREPRLGQGSRAAHTREGEARWSVAIPSARRFRGRERPAVLRQRESALRGVRRLRRQAAVSPESHRTGDLQPLQGHDRGLGPGAIGIRRNKAAISDRGRDRPGCGTLAARTIQSGDGRLKERRARRSCIKPRPKHAAAFRLL
jgi:site-specific DNA recombinase